MYLVVGLDFFTAVNSNCNNARPTLVYLQRPQLSDLLGTVAELRRIATVF